MRLLENIDIQYCDFPFCGDTKQNKLDIINNTKC